MVAAPNLPWIRFVWGDLPGSGVPINVLPKLSEATTLLETGN